jgi:hypothetical protein
VFFLSSLSITKLFKKDVLTCVIFPDIPADGAGSQVCIWPLVVSCFEADKMD